jgi:threonine dehydratase
MNEIPVYSDIVTASHLISKYVNKTPVFTSRQVNEQTGGEVFFKCENFQRAGAFKFRGACNTVFSLSNEDASKGVATHSSGNHAQALALAASLRGIKATVVMPSNAPKIKVAAVKGYGAEVILCEPTLESRESTLVDVVNRTGATFIHPYNNPGIIAGQGTAALELLQEVPDLDFILTPVGGGGLLSGTAIAAKHIKPGIKVIGTEPEIADDAMRSFKEGRLIRINQTNTVADGLRTSLGELTFAAIQRHVDDIVTVPEASIIRDMRFIWERMNMIIEASCAVPVSALFDDKVNIKGKKAGVIITGGNVDLDSLIW